MKYITAAHTDAGIVKSVNQDSLLIQQARTGGHGNVLLAVICDGMGGLADGEIASACVIHTFSEWFENELPLLYQYEFSVDTLHESWHSLILDADRRIRKYSSSRKVTMGTTCAALLIADGEYYIMNIGDSRVYVISENVFQLTKDQTYIQREMDAGRMTYEESLVDPRRSALLSCIGAGSSLTPDFYYGNVFPEQCFLLCCDGFRHVVGPEEFYQHLNAQASTDAETMRAHLIYLTELIKARNETDNITAALVKIVS